MTYHRCQGEGLNVQGFQQQCGAWNAAWLRGLRVCGVCAEDRHLRLWPGGGDAPLASAANHIDLLWSSMIYCYHLLSTIIYHHLPSSTIIYHHLPSSTIIYHHLPSSTIIYHHLPSSTHIQLSRTPCLICLPVSPFLWPFFCKHSSDSLKGPPEVSQGLALIGKSQNKEAMHTDLKAAYFNIFNLFHSICCFTRWARGSTWLSNCRPSAAAILFGAEEALGANLVVTARSPA